MDLYVDAAPGGEAVNLAIAHALVRRADSMEDYQAVHIYRSTGRSLVFGRSDTRMPGFPQAVRAARDAGFEPLIRAAGGRAVAYTDQAVVIHHVRHEHDPARGHDARFVELGNVLVDALGSVGVLAQLGAVPGEYCPGAHSINARGQVKLVGTAQRIVRRAWLFASLVVVGDEDVTRPVLTEVYRHLGQDFDPNSVGSLSVENDSLDVTGVTEALLGVYAPFCDAMPIADAVDLLGAVADTVANYRVSV